MNFIENTHFFDVSKGLCDMLRPMLAVGPAVWVEMVDLEGDIIICSKLIRAQLTNVCPLDANCSFCVPPH